MDIKADGIDGEVEIIIDSDIISMQEAIDFKRHLSFIVAKKHIKKLKVYIGSAYSIPSSIIGVLLKYKEIEHIQIEVFVKKEELLGALEKLNLAELLNVKIY